MRTIAIVTTTAAAEKIKSHKLQSSRRRFRLWMKTKIIFVPLPTRFIDLFFFFLSFSTFYVCASDVRYKCVFTVGWAVSWLLTFWIFILWLIWPISPNKLGQHFKPEKKIHKNFDLIRLIFDRENDLLIRRRWDF